MSRKVSMQYGRPSTVNRNQTENWELLWENDDPSAAFATQTIALDLTEYDAVLVIIRYSTSTSSHVSQIGLKGYTAHTSLVGNFNAATAYIQMRNFKAEDSGVFFDNCYRRAFTATSAASVNTNYCIPFRIYGIKFG